MQVNFHTFIFRSLVIFNDIIRFEFKNLMIYIFFILLLKRIIDFRFWANLIILSEYILNWRDLVIDLDRTIYL